MKEVLKLALDALIDGDWYIGQLEDIVYSPADSGMHAIRAKAQNAIKALEEALAKQALIQRAEEAFEASQQEQDMPKIGCVNHDCDKCKEQEQENLYDLAVKADNGGQP
jgi:hypothetical protein